MILLCIIYNLEKEIIMGKDRTETIKGEVVEKKITYDENDDVVKVKRKIKRRVPKTKMMRPGLGGQLGPTKRC